MIKANELRIGNLVLQDGKMKSVNYIDAAFVYKFVSFKGEEFNADNLYADRECDPIPLTEEILLKCGFKKSPICGAYYIDVDDELQIYVGTTKRISLINKLDEDEHYSIIQVHSLHQLQNLYFALTGEELTVNI